MTEAISSERSASPIAAWIVALAWASLVWRLGGEGLSLESTSHFLGPLLQWLLPGISPETSFRLQWAIRKTAHLTEYAVLSFLYLRALLAGRSPLFARAAVAAFVLTAAFAAADETRQSLSATRLGSIWDVALDSVGAALGIGIGYGLRTRWPGLGGAIGGEARRRKDASRGEAK